MKKLITSKDLYLVINLPNLVQEYLADDLAILTKIMEYIAIRRAGKRA